MTPQRRVDATAAARAVRAAGRPAGAGAVPQGAAAPPAVGRRVAAYAIDLALAFVVGLVGYLLGAVTGLPVTGLTVALGAVVGVGQIVAEGLRGATLGAHLLGLRTVDDRTGAAPGVPRAFLRQLVVALGMPVCLVGNWVIVASAAWDREPARRGWHDKASGTRVVRAGASPAATASGAAVAGYRSPSGAPRPVPAQGVGAVPAADALYAPPPAP
ncbi:RDD family protein, partial [Cellulomonas sp. B6]|uniref:RDD family protein n=1 Tax=Cellulomonas sp. B6 TaxID=1295626 RepID=UPI001680E113